MANTRYKDKVWLTKEYVSGKSQSQIASECGVSQATICKWMKRFDIPTRDMHECHLGPNNGEWIDNPIKDKELFETEYIKNKLTMREIAKKYGVSLRTVARWMRIHKITPRSRQEWLKIHPRTGENSSNWKGGVSHPHCAICGKPITYGATLCRDCQVKFRYGPDNPNYKGKADVMTLVREWSRKYWRPLVLARDAYTCQYCGCSEHDGLEAHHIIPLHELVAEAIQDMPLDTPLERFEAAKAAINNPMIRSIENGITLCKICHREVHKKKCIHTKQKH